MDWVSAMEICLTELEKSLLGPLCLEDIARKAGVSGLYLQKGFRFLTGYTMTEYVRNRRLYLAALEAVKGERIIDLALKYGYETPESFTKAFARFHGLPPQQLRRDPGALRVFLPLRVSISIRGGEKMDFTVEPMPAMTMIGFQREFDSESAYREIPRFWDEVMARYARGCECPGAAELSALERAVKENAIGEFGLCVDDLPGSRFRYLIAGQYRGGPVPEGLTLYDLPALTWAKFPCLGPLPGSLQAVNTRIFRDWLPGNPIYEIAAGMNLEWYSPDCAPDDTQYRSAIWIPVRERGQGQGQ